MSAITKAEKEVLMKRLRSDDDDENGGMTFLKFCWDSSNVELSRSFWQTVISSTRAGRGRGQHWHQLREMDLSGLILAHSNDRLEVAKALAHVLQCTNRYYLHKSSMTSSTKKKKKKKHSSSKSSSRSNAEAAGVGFETMKLYSNYFGDECIQILSEALVNNHTLKALELSCNQIGSDGAVALAQMIRQNETLESIDLSRNHIDSKGLIALADALIANQTLKSLDLECNHMQTDAAMALANALRQNQTLERLHLTGVDLDGTTAIFDALSKNKGLKKLSMGQDSCHQDPRLFETLKSAMQCNYSLEELEYCTKLPKNILESLQLNQTNPFKAELVKHGFPRRLLRSSNKKSSSSFSPPCFASAIAKLNEFEHLSALYQFVREQPHQFEPLEEEEEEETAAAPFPLAQDNKKKRMRLQEDNSEGPEAKSEHVPTRPRKRTR